MPSTFTAAQEPCSPELTAHMSKLNGFYFYVYGRLVMPLDLGELALVGDVLCAPAVHAPSHRPGASGSQGRFWAVFVDLLCKLPDSSFLASGFCPQVGEAGVEA